MRDIKKNVYIIAEAGVNHNGSLELALKLCDAAKDAGVDAVKFQTWKTENLMTQDAELASYQKENTDNFVSQFEMSKQLELSYQDFVVIKAHCEDIGITFLSTPDENESLDFLVDLGMDFIKIGSGEVTNIPYLRKIGAKKMRVILSTGMSTLEDVEVAYNELINAGAKCIDLLHCTTNYPCPVEEVNLRAMLTLKERFGKKVGYSDHTIGIEVPIAAVALGAEIIEKHFTLDKNMEGPDHIASLEPDKLKQMVDAIRKIEKALGSGEKIPNKSEIKIRKVVFKSIVAQKEIKKGELFTENNLTAKRVGKGIDVRIWDEVIGKTASKNYQINELIQLEG